MDEITFMLEEDPIQVFHREKSVTGFEALGDTLLLGVRAAGGLDLKPVLFYHPRNPRTFKRDAEFTLCGLCKWNSKA